MLGVTSKLWGCGKKGPKARYFCRFSRHSQFNNGAYVKMTMSTALIESVSDEALSRAATVIKCLGHPLRLRLLDALEGGEKTVSDLQEQLNLPQATVSQQLSTLRGRGVVECRRSGANMLYWIIEPKVSKILNCIREYDI